MSTEPPETAGQRLWKALDSETPLQVVGAVNAYCGLLAQRAGFKALYLSGGGVAGASYGLPDLGMTNLHDVLEDVRRITGVASLPLLVDADTGWGHALAVGRTVRELIAAGAAGLHLEDQVEAKRCGHRPGKALVTVDEMCQRIRAAVDARTDRQFVIMARTDAVACEGPQAGLDRARAYVDAGADMIFPEALTGLDDYTRFAGNLNVPVLANLTEFGRTPLFTLDQLRAAGIRLALYPLSAFRAMSAAALRVYETIRQQGTQQEVLDIMQTREELYEVLDYHRHEQKIDRQLAEHNHDK